MLLVRILLPLASRSSPLFGALPSPFQPRPPLGYHASQAGGLIVDMVLNISLGAMALVGALVGWVLLSDWRKKSRPPCLPKSLLRLRVEWAGLEALRFVGAFLFVVAGLIGLSELMPYLK